jgi:phosphonate transport system substrate-binding protein
MKGGAWEQINDHKQGKAASLKVVSIFKFVFCQTEFFSKRRNNMFNKRWSMILLTVFLTFILTQAVFAVDNNFPSDIIASGLSGPFGMAFDAEENLYIANELEDSNGMFWISKLYPNGNLDLQFSGDYVGPSGVTFNSSGELFISDDNNRILKVDLSDGSWTEFIPDDDAGLLPNPNAIAFDSNDNLFVANAGGYISKFDSDGGLIAREFSTGFDTPQSIVVDDGAGVLYTSDFTGQIYQIDKSTGDWTVFADTGYPETQGGLVLDADGNLFYSAYEDGKVLQIDPTGQVVSICISGLVNPRGLLLDSEGALLVTDRSTGEIYRYLGCEGENSPPEVGPISAPADPVQLGFSVSASSEFTDPDVGDTHEALWDWGDNRTSEGTVDESGGSGTVSGEHVYLVPGVYTVTLTVFDDHENSGESIYHYVVAFEPSAGFVTGGGWINSPEGAYVPDPSLTGKATFGFVAKYNKKTQDPEGNTEFQFHTADLNFKSTSYQWLVVAGRKAQFKGEGTINGDGDFGFMLTAIDGDLLHGDGIDRFRIKIIGKDTDTLVYDNQIDSPDSADPTSALGGGSIVIHRKINGSDFSIGLVTDPSGIDDKGWNWLSYQGMLRAHDELGVQINLYEPASEEELALMVEQCVNDGNQLCIGVGFLLGDAILNAANNNPDTAFAILDYTQEQYPDNLRGIVFSADEVGYLAGVLAGRMTTSNVIGTFGGSPIPPVDEFMYGYRNGAQCINPDVEVLMDYSNDFGNPELGETIAQEMMGQGVDVIFPVAGLTGTGALLTTSQAGSWAIGVDTDQYLSVFENGAVTGSEFILTSAMKNLDNAVFMTITDLLLGIYSPGTFHYSLALDGVGLAPFHEADIPNEFKDEIAEIQQGIIDGSINIYDDCRPIGSPGHPIKIFFTPNADPQVINEGGTVMAEFLKQETGLSFEVIVPASPADTVLQMCASTEDSIGFLPGIGYVFANDLCGVDVSYKAIRYGWGVYWSEILVPRESDIDEITDLDGLSWAIPDYSSMSGFLAPLVMWDNAGITPGEIVETGSHDQAVMAIYNDEVGFATAYFSPPLKEPGWQIGDDPDIPDELVPDCAPNEEGQLWCDDWRVLDARASISFEAPDVVQNLRILDISDPIANDGLAFGPDFPAELRPQIEAAMAIFAASTEWGDSIGRSDFYGWTGIDPAVDADYDSTRDIVALAGITLEEWGQPEPPQQPSLHVVPAYPEIHGHEWPEDAFVSITVTDPDTGELLFEDAKFVYEEPTWCIAPCFDLLDRFVIEPGQVVTMSSDEYTREVHVTSLVVTNVDPGADTVSGTAEPFSEVWIDIHTEDGVSRHVAADSGGNWTADFSQFGDEEGEYNTYDLVAGIGGRSIQFEDPEYGDDGTLAYWGAPNPRIQARPEEDAIEGWEWPEGNGSVLLSVDYFDEETSQIVTYTATGDAWPPPWEDPNTYVRFDLPFDLQVGDMITMSSGATVKEHIVTNLTVTLVDPATNTVTGTADAGAYIQVWPHDAGECWQDLTVQDTGSNPESWSVDFTDCYEIVPGSNGAATQPDNDGDETWIEWWVPNPTLTAAPLENYVDGRDWPEEATIYLTIDDHDPLTPDYTDSGTAIYPEGDPWSTWVYFDLGEFDLQPGYNVTLTDTVTTKIHDVTGLSLVEIDPGTDTISGTTDSGNQIQLWVHDEDGDVWVSPDGSGNWEADLSEFHDLVPGDCGAAAQFDEDGDQTKAEWCVPNPHISAKPLQHAVEGWEWPNETEVTLTINSIPQGTATTFYPDWDPGTTYVRFDLDFDLQPGDEIVMSGGGITKTHYLTNLTVDPIYPDDTAVSGTAALNSEVEVWLHQQGCNQWLTADVDFGGGLGSWTVDFAGCHDLQPGDDGAAVQRDDDNDETWIDWRVPDPRFTIQPYHQWAYGYGWPLNTDVTITIYNSFGGTEIYSETQSSGDGGDMFFELYNAPVEGLDMAPGWYIEMTDGVTTKDHVILDPTFDYVDEGANTAGGTGPAGHDANVNVSSDVDGFNIVTQIQTGGAWFADFGAEGYDVHDVTDANVEVWDEDGDGTIVHFDIPTLHVVPAYPEVHGHGWPTIETATLIIGDPAAPDYTSSKPVNDDPWCGDPCFDLSGGVFTILPGQVVTLTDGAITKTVHVTSLMITSVDPISEKVYGTADAGSEVWVNIYSGGGSTRHITADSSGNWFADFSVPGDEDFEQDTFDLLSGTYGRAIQVENDYSDDGTMAYWDVP